jgi:hypothetical protein
VRFVEARTPHEARPLKIAHGSDALCRDAQLSRTPPSDRRVCGAAPLVLGRLRLLADRGSVPQLASPSDRIHRDSVAGLFGSGEADSPYPGSDSPEPASGLAVPGRRTRRSRAASSTEPGSGLAVSGERTRRAREANSPEPGNELAVSGERTRRARGANSPEPGNELAVAGGADSPEPGSLVVVPARSAWRPPCAPTPRPKRPPALPRAAVVLQNLPFRDAPAGGGMWCMWDVRQMPRLGDWRSIGNLCIVCGPSTPARTTHRPPLRPLRPVPAPAHRPAPAGASAAPAAPAPPAPPAPAAAPAGNSATPAMRRREFRISRLQWPSHKPGDL